MDVKQLCKRSICCLAAVSMMFFAVFVAPFRGSAFDLVAFIDAAVDFGFNATSSILDRLGAMPGGSIPVNFYAKPVLDLAYQFWSGSGYSGGAKEKWDDFRNQGNFNEIDVNTSFCISGLYSRNNKVHTVSLYTYSNTTLNPNNYFSPVACEDFQILIELLPADGYGREDYSLSYSCQVVTDSTRRMIYHTFSDSNNLPVWYRLYLYSNGDYLTSPILQNVTSSLLITCELTVSNTIRSLPDSPSDLLSSFYLSSNVCGLGLGSFSDGGLVSQFPHADQYQTFTEDNIYNYYQNDVYPYIVNEYPDIDFNSPQYYYEINNPTEPTETGEAAPFTLPPEWLEDRVDLETDHFTVPYTEMVQDPWEYIQGQATTIGEETTTEPVRGQFRTETAIETVTPEPTLPGVLHADPAVLSTMWDFENFAQELLSRSGLWAIFAGLSAAGICIRLISLH